MLSNLNQFLTSNRGFVNRLSGDMSSTGFSEDCRTSLLHQIVNVLNKIMTSEYDDKVLSRCIIITVNGTSVLIPVRSTRVLCYVTVEFATKCTVLCDINAQTFTCCVHISRLVLDHNRGVQLFNKDQHLRSEDSGHGGAV